MKTPSNDSRDSGERYRQLLQRLVDAMQLVDGRVRFGFHEGSVTRLRLVCNCVVVPEGNGHRLHPAWGRSLRLDAVSTVFGPEYVAEFRAAAGRFGICAARVRKGRVGRLKFSRCYLEPRPA